MTNENRSLEERPELDKWLQWKRGLELQGDWIIGKNPSPEWIPINLLPAPNTTLDALLSDVTVEEPLSDH